MTVILLIEDHPDMRENITLILRRSGHTVLTAANGREGLETARDEMPDLIVCDVMMPGLDGHDVLRAVRAERAIAGTPFIFLTARGEKRDLRTGMNLGADDYLTKPVSAEDLLAAVKTRLEREAVRRADFKLNFDSATPLESLGLTPREAEVLLWVAQGKTNSEIGTILGTATKTVSKHLEHIFDKLGVETRTAASRNALDVLARR
jgi:DNA-binding NarL/FixJ family response regulator